jgi:predicted peroxiredoxin
MAEEVVIVLTAGLDDERASVAWSFANGGLNAGLRVTVFLTSNAVDSARRGAAAHAHPNPFDPPIQEMIDSFLTRGGRLLVCPPCAKLRNYGAEHLLEGVELIGSKAVFERVKAGAETISF